MQLPAPDHATGAPGWLHMAGLPSIPQVYGLWHSTVHANETEEPDQSRLHREALLAYDFPAEFPGRSARLEYLWKACYGPGAGRAPLPPLWSRKHLGHVRGRPPSSGTNVDRMGNSLNTTAGRDTPQLATPLTCGSTRSQRQTMRSPFNYSASCLMWTATSTYGPSMGSGCS